MFTVKIWTKDSKTRVTHYVSHDEATQVYNEAAWGLMMGQDSSLARVELWDEHDRKHELIALQDVSTRLGIA